ncbi:MAG: S8 family serine peptidase [Candidatus Thermoplasmatota archaeon]|nr:S8 family serine peptidase [Candidatus Thermoplasmatota archaeon]
MIIAVGVILLAQLLAPAAGSIAVTVDPDPVPGLVVGVFEENVPEDIEAYVEGWGEVMDEGEYLPWVAVETDNVPLAIANLRSHPENERARQAQWAYLDHVPNDPEWDEQWGLPTVGFEEAWDTTLGSQLVSVAIVDSGISTHVDLTGNLCGPHLTIDPFGGSPLSDSLPHGTHVAGIVAAMTDNGEGVAGASQSCLMSMKVFSRVHYGSEDIFSFYVAEAIAAATASGADIINLSLHTSGAPQLLMDAIDAAWGAGVLLVAAAGNRGCPGPDSFTVNYPAYDGHVIAVSALTAPGEELAGFSSCGSAVELTAPGEDILSTLPGGYGELSGTSMSSPMVAGLAALVWSVDVLLTNAQVRCILIATAQDIGEPGHDPYFGFGRIDAAQAVQAAEDPASVGC